MGSGSRSGRQCSDSASLVAARMPGASGVARECVLAGYAPDLLLPRGRSAAISPDNPASASGASTDTKERAMQAHKIGTREQWLAARLELLDAEKKLTRQGDDGAAAPGATLGTAGQDLPLADRRRQRHAGRPVPGRSQLLVYHFMFGPDYKAGCRPARRSPTVSTASSRIWRITT